MADSSELATLRLQAALQQANVRVTNTKISIMDYHNQLVEFEADVEKATQAIAAAQDE